MDPLPKAPWDRVRRPPLPAGPPRYRNR